LGVQVPPALRSSCNYGNDERKKGSAMSENLEGKELNIFARIALFYRQVINELRKVVWPSRNMLTTYTSVVLVFVAFIIAVVSLFDLGLTKLVFWVFAK
jgi:preprotein translocase subunit SecE